MWIVRIAKAIGKTVVALGIGSIILSGVQDVAKQYVPEIIKNLIPSLSEISCMVGQARNPQPKAEKFSVYLAKLDDDPGGDATRELADVLLADQSFDLRRGCRSYSNPDRALEAASDQIARQRVELFIWGRYSKRNAGVEIRIVDNLSFVRALKLAHYPMIMESDNSEEFSLYHLSSDDEVAKLGRRVRSTLRKYAVNMAQGSAGIYWFGLSGDAAEKNLRSVSPLFKHARADNDDPDVIADLAFSYGAILAHVRDAPPGTYEEAIDNLEQASSNYSGRQDKTPYVTAQVFIAEALRRKADATGEQQTLRRALETLRTVTQVDRSGAPGADWYVAFMELGGEALKLGSDTSQKALLQEAANAYQKARDERDTKPGSYEWSQADEHIQKAKRAQTSLFGGPGDVDADIAELRQEWHDAESEAEKSLRLTALGLRLVEEGTARKNAALLREGADDLRALFKNGAKSAEESFMLASALIEIHKLDSAATEALAEATRINETALGQSAPDKNPLAWAALLSQLPDLYPDDPCFPPTFGSQAAQYEGQLNSTTLAHALAAGDLAVMLDKYGRCAKNVTRLEEAAFLYRDALATIRKHPPAADGPDGQYAELRRSDYRSALATLVRDYELSLPPAD